MLLDRKFFKNWQFDLDLNGGHIPEESKCREP